MQFKECIKQNENLWRLSVMSLFRYSSGTQVLLTDIIITYNIFKREGFDCMCVRARACVLIFAIVKH